MLGEERREGESLQVTLRLLGSHHFTPLPPTLTFSPGLGLLTRRRGSECLVRSVDSGAPDSKPINRGGLTLPICGMGAAALH